MALIARALASRRGLQIATPLLRASSATLHFLPRAERIRLGPTLFRLSREQVPEKILLLDDIVTTGTTIAAAAKLLREGGAKQVHVAVIARQLEK
jgi:predicted amidophosphoribosyltransferase